MLDTFYLDRFYQKLQGTLDRPNMISQTQLIQQPANPSYFRTVYVSLALLQIGPGLKRHDAYTLLHRSWDSVDFQ